MKPESANVECCTLEEPGLSLAENVNVLQGKPLVDLYATVPELMFRGVVYINLLPPCLVPFLSVL